MSSDDPHDLKRFLDAQAPVMARVREELAAGAKRSHWMWFIFPQIAGLGRSSTAEHFAIQSLDEARSFLAHAVLGARLREATQLVLDAGDRSIHEIFGSPDDLKFHSSMTLFARAASDGNVFRAALAKYFGGVEDAATLRQIA